MDFFLDDTTRALETKYVDDREGSLHEKNHEIGHGHHRQKKKKRSSGLSHSNMLTLK